MSQTAPLHQGFELFVLRRGMGVQAGTGEEGVWDGLGGKIV